MAVHVYSLTNFCQHPSAHDLDPQREAPRNLEISSPWYAYLAECRNGVLERLEAKRSGDERGVISRYQTIHGSWDESWKHILKESEIITKDGGVVILPTQCINFFDRIEQITQNE